MHFNRSEWKVFVFAVLCVLVPDMVFAATFKKEVIDPAYEHNKWKTSCGGIERGFAAFMSCFDDKDDDNGNGTADVLGVPEWVSYEMKEVDHKCRKKYSRPSKWFGDSDLISQKVMPTDDSYSYPKRFLKGKSDWFSRGHLAMKMHAERLGQAEGWNTHTFFNAVPQRQLFNAGIWLDLEYLTAAWAQDYGRVWVIAGPIFADRFPVAYLGEQGELPVAIPDALFKIVIKEGVESDVPDVLAFIYPQVGPGYYSGKPYNHLRYVTTVDEIEKLTGIDFFTGLSTPKEKALEMKMADQLWPASNAGLLPVCSSRTANF